MKEDMMAAREAVAARRAAREERISQTVVMPAQDDGIAWGRSVEAPGPAPAPYPSHIDANVPPGVHQQSYSGPLAPFMGSHALPTGQTISVSMNAPNPNLPFKEWMLRGVVSGVGRGAAWPFRLVALTVETIVTSIIDIFKSVFKVAAYALLVPALLIVGVRLASHVNRAPTLEAAAHSVTQDGRHAARGLMEGATDRLQPEIPDEQAPVLHHR